MRYGLLPDTHDPKAYVFGGQQLPLPALQPDGQWLDFLPEYEAQSTDGWDSYGCTVFGTINALETLYSRRYGFSPNFSERFHYNLVPVRPPGSSPHLVAESIRKHGVVDQGRLPFTSTYEEFTTPCPLSPDLIEEGEAWLTQHTFGHEYLWQSDPGPERRETLLREALRHSPIGVSVTAWHEEADGSYGDNSEANNHWCICVGYRERDGRFRPIIFDSYNHSIKELTPEHVIGVAKRYYLDDAPVPDFITKMVECAKQITSSLWASLH